MALALGAFASWVPQCSAIAILARVRAFSTVDCVLVAMTWSMSAIVTAARTERQKESVERKHGRCYWREFQL